MGATPIGHPSVPGAWHGVIVAVFTQVTSPVSTLYAQSFVSRIDPSGPEPARPAVKFHGYCVPYVGLVYQMLKLTGGVYAAPGMVWSTMTKGVEQSRGRPPLASTSDRSMQRKAIWPTVGSDCPGFCRVPTVQSFVPTTVPREMSVALMPRLKGKPAQREPSESRWQSTIG